MSKRVGSVETNRDHDGGGGLRWHQFQSFRNSLLSMNVIGFHWMLIIDMAVFSTKLSAFFLVCAHVLSELYRFFVALIFLLHTFGSAVGSLSHYHAEFKGLPNSMLSLLGLGSPNPMAGSNAYHQVLGISLCVGARVFQTMMLINEERIMSKYAEGMKYMVAISQICSGLMLVACVCYIIFQMFTHRDALANEETDGGDGKDVDVSLVFIGITLVSLSAFFNLASSAHTMAGSNAYRQVLGTPRCVGAQVFQTMMLVYEERIMSKYAEGKKYIAAISQICSGLMLVACVCYIIFQMFTHRDALADEGTNDGDGKDVNVSLVFMGITLVSLSAFFNPASSAHTMAGSIAYYQVLGIWLCMGAQVFQTMMLVYDERFMRKYAEGKKYMVAISQICSGLMLVACVCYIMFQMFTHSDALADEETCYRDGKDIDVSLVFIGITLVSLSAYFNPASSANTMAGSNAYHQALGISLCVGAQVFKTMMLAYEERIMSKYAEGKKYMVAISQICSGLMLVACVGYIIFLMFTLRDALADEETDYGDGKDVDVSLVFVGITLVSLSAFFNPASWALTTAGSNAYLQVLDISLCVGAQVFQTLMLVYEKRIIMSKYTVPPLLVVGMKGTFGILFGIVLLGVLNAVSIESTPAALYQMGHSVDNNADGGCGRKLRAEAWSFLCSGG